MYDFIAEHLALFMFLALAVLLFSGFPVGFVLGGVALAFGFIGYLFDAFALIEFFNFMPRIWGGVADNLILVAAPMFIFMGVMLERSGVAEDLLDCLQTLLRRVPGGLALSVTVMGTVMAATTGIIGASIVMMTLIALPPMLARRYNVALATGTIAASGCLGILIPPSIMLVIMADMMAISVGHLFLGAVFPGLLLAALYFVYILVACTLKPSLAPISTEETGPEGISQILLMVLRSFLPPVFLIFLVLGSIFFGWATPTEASAIGAGGAILLTALNGRLSFGMLKDVVRNSTLTTGMVFLIIIAATCFSYVFRSLGGDDVILDLFEAAGLGPWGTVALVMTLIFLLGFFFDWIEITLIVLPVFTPIIAQLDFGEHLANSRDVVYWFAMLFAINLQTSFLTPPFGFALFYLKGVSHRSVRMEDIYKGIIPFVILQVTGLILVMLFPETVLWLPRAVFG